MQKISSSPPTSQILRGSWRTINPGLADTNFFFGKSLKDLGTDHSWDVPESKRRYRFWRDKENQRILLHKVAKELNIRVPMEWGKVKRSLLYEHGIFPILQEYGGSFQQALVTLYPGFHFQLN